MGSHDEARLGSRIESEFSFINVGGPEDSDESTSIVIEGAPDLPSILVIDDNRNVIDIISKTLSAERFSIFASTKGDEGLSLFKTHKGKISLVIIDECMPDYSGLELLESMRRIKPQLQCILTSGYYTDDEPRPVLDKRFASFLPKPFDIKSLLAMAKDRLNLAS